MANSMYCILYFKEDVDMSAPITPHYQITQDVKEKAESILQKPGIPVSSAFEMFYRQIIAHNGLPFEPPIANETTINAMNEAREGKGRRYDSVKEMFSDLEDFELRPTRLGTHTELFG